MPKVNNEPRIALNASDCERIAPTLRAALKGRLDLTQAVRVGANKQDVAAAFVCGDLEAALVCDAIRSEDRKAGDVPCRVYVRSGDAWSEPGPGVTLTVLVGGQARLSPLVFGGADKPRTTVAVMVGRRT